MFAALEQKLINWAEVVPLEWFVFIASFVEEVIAPIPSPTVMILSGSIANAQGYLLTGLLVLIVIGTIGKTIGAVVVYVIADKAENIFVKLFGKFLNVTNEEVVALGQKLGKGKRDYVLLTFLRALPIMPSVVLSVGSGVLKIPMKLFIFSTFFGTLVRDGLYLLAGYYGAEILFQIINQSTQMQTIVKVVIVFGVFAFIFYKRSQIQKRNATEA